jgi:hypothetical protein
MAASGMRVLPTWVPAPEQVAAEAARWEHRARSTRNVFWQKFCPMCGNAIPPIYLKKLNLVLWRCC